MNSTVSPKLGIYPKLGLFMALDKSTSARLMVMGAGLLWSAGAPLIRFLDQATEWQFLFYRNMAMIAALLVILKLRAPKERLISNFVNDTRANILGGFFLAIGFVAFLFSINYTTVATTLFMMSSSPILAAIIAYFFLREVLTARQWIAIFGGFVGIIIMIGEGISADSAFGVFMGLITALGFAGFSIMLRWGRTFEMLPTVCYAGLFTAAVSAVMAIATNQGLAIGSNDLMIAVVYGIGGMAVGMSLYVVGSRYLVAAELTLLSLVEVVLAPIWVAIIFTELPSYLTILGGGILLLSIMYQSLGGRPQLYGVQK